MIIAAAQPATFTSNLSGKGPGIVVGVKADGNQYLVDATHPMSPGDVAVIYCAGLGAVSPVITAGSAASLTVLSNTTSPVTVTMGGKSAQVLFAGLAPGFAGLYQINAIVPSGIAAASDVPVVITAAGQQSTPVTIGVAAK